MAKRENTNFKQKLATIADLIADQVIGGGSAGYQDLTLAEKTNAFKELKSYYAMLHKINPEEGASFDGFAKQIRNLKDRAGTRNGHAPAVGVESGADPDF